MSKVHAFICDYCRALVPSDECQGISPQEDMFDKLNSFKLIHNPDKAEIHFCDKHYHDLVIGPASREFSKRLNEKAYALKIRELSYDLRKTTVERLRAFTLAKADKKK